VLPTLTDSLTGKLNHLRPEDIRPKKLRLDVCPSLGRLFEFSKATPPPPGSLEPLKEPEVFIKDGNPPEVVGPVIWLAVENGGLWTKSGCLKSLKTGG
jgi:hypothetical protein